jgi:hypothetical protein
MKKEKDPRQADLDNRARQLNPICEEYYLSRQMPPKQAHREATQMRVRLREKVASG